MKKKNFEIVDDLITPEFLDYKNCRCDIVPIDASFYSTSYREEDLLSFKKDTKIELDISEALFESTKRAKETLEFTENKLRNVENNRMKHLRREKEILKKEIKIFEKIEELRDFLRKSE